MMAPMAGCLWDLLLRVLVASVCKRQGLVQVRVQLVALAGAGLPRLAR